MALTNKIPKPKSAVAMHYGTSMKQYATEVTFRRRKIRQRRNYSKLPGRIKPRARKTRPVLPLSLLDIKAKTDAATGEESMCRTLVDPG